MRYLAILWSEWQIRTLPRPKLEKRQKLMQEQSAAAKAIKGAVEAKDYATVEAKAKDLMGSSEKIVGAFPAGSGTGKTKAKPEIWEKICRFRQPGQESKQSGH